MPMLNPYVGDLEKYSPTPKTDVDLKGLLQTWMQSRALKENRLKQDRDKQILDAVISGQDIPAAEPQAQPTGIMGRLGEFMTGGRPQAGPSSLERMMAEAKIKQQPLTPTDELIQRGKAAKAEMDIYGAGGPAPSLYGASAVAPTATPRPRLLEGAPAEITGRPEVGRADLVPTGYDPFGRPKGYEKDPLAVKSEELSQEILQKQKQASLIGERNVSTVAGAARRFMETYADAFREGGIGSKVRQIKSGAALYLGGRAGEQFPATAALTGMRTEAITKMMPMLTQQGDKEGSVRLVSTVFDKLIKTWPADNTPPSPAKRMVTETIRNMVGFAKAMKIMNVTNESVENLDDKQLKALGDSIEYMSSKIKLTPAEKKNQDDLIRYVLEPLKGLSAGGKRPAPVKSAQTFKNLWE